MGTIIRKPSSIQNVTNGIAKVNKALITNSNNDISNLRNLSLISTEDGSTNPVPSFIIENKFTQRGSSGEIKFNKNVTTEAGEHIGEINFYAKDSGNNTSEHFCGILGQVATHTAGSESGKISLQLKTDGNATMVTGLLLEGHSTTNGHVDVTLGAGADSIITCPGNIVCSGLKITSSSHTFTSDGGGTGLIKSHTKYVHATSGNRDHIITLPTIDGIVNSLLEIGHELTISLSGSNGGELRTQGNTVKINNTICTNSSGVSTNSLAIAAGAVYICKAISASAWIISKVDNLGVHTGGGTPN
jgi:hypothetical protein